MNRLSLTDFNFNFPPDLIAHEPLAERDASRLLVRHRAADLRHSSIRNLAENLPKRALVILNDSRVFPSRIFGHTQHGGRVEIMLLEPEPPTDTDTDTECTWRAIGRPLRKLQPGSRIVLDLELSCHVDSSVHTADNDLTPVQVRFPISHADLMRWIESKGFVPLPPYIKRSELRPASESPDRDRYQTIYCQETGSVAAPTAGLHFTRHVLESMHLRDIDIAFVTLHVGGGTFLPVRRNNVSEHHMHEERFFVPQATLEVWRKARTDHRNIIAVGTTAFRCMESLYQAAKGSDKRMSELCDRWQRTSLFIYPDSRQSRFKAQTVDALLTNFHQPMSTLFMLVCALIGYDEAHEMYQLAMREHYRLFSYGDACLLWL